MNDNGIIKELSLLVSYSLEGEIDSEQFSRLQQIIAGSKQAREYYYRLLATHAFLSDTNNVVLFRNEKERAADFEILSELLSSENTSPSIEIPKLANQSVVDEVTDKVSDVSNDKVKFYHRIKVLVSVAAVFILCVMMLHTFLQPVEIATVTKSYSVTVTGDEEIIDGTRLVKGESEYRLKRGLLELTYDCGANVIIESPTSFNMIGGKSIKLNSGSIYVKVYSKEAKGFKVIMPNSDVIDYGTEFGVKVDANGASEVHMTKGSASLVSNNSQQDMPILLTAGYAGRVDNSGRITDIEIKANDFVRSFDQKTGIVWHGQDLSLADMIAGGNGLGSGLKQASLDPSNGKFIPWQLASDRYGDDKYRAVIESDYIDGVFVPDGGNGPVIVSSQDHTWECPDTFGFYKYNITSSLRLLDDISGIPVGNSQSDRMLAESQQRTQPVRSILPEAWDKSDNAERPSIFIHSNLGITYNLDKLRTVVPERRISSFRTKFGVVEKFMYVEDVAVTDMHIDLWILIDGKIKYSEKAIDATRLLDIDVDIDDSDKFISLVVTQAGDRYGASFDWGLFVDPVLKLAN